jgi:hypothetical protein
MFFTTVSPRQHKHIDIYTTIVYNVSIMGEKFVEFIMLGEVPGTHFTVGFRTSIYVSVFLVASTLLMYYMSHRKHYRRVMHYHRGRVELIAI